MIEKKNPVLKSRMRNYLPWWQEYYRINREYDKIKNKFREEIITKKNQEKFLKEKIFKVLEIFKPYGYSKTVISI